MGHRDPPYTYSGPIAMADLDDNASCVYVQQHPSTRTRWERWGENSPANIAKRITLPFHAPTAESRQEAKSQCLHDLIAGAVAGSAGVVVGHPFDTAKLRMQMASHSSTSLASALQLNGLMRGIAAPFAMAAFVNASIFTTFGETSRLWDHHVGNAADSIHCRENSIEKNLVCGGVTGVTSSLILAPTEHIKCKMQAGSEVYANSLDAGKSIWKSHGVRGLYRGLMATCLRQAPGFSIYFANYDIIKSRLGESWVASIVAGGTAGSLSWAVIYPIDLLKSKIQVLPLTVPSSERSLWNVARGVWRQGGWRSLYHGIGITVLRAFPVNAIIFPTYELTLACVRNWG